VGAIIYGSCCVVQIHAVFDGRRSLEDIFGPYSPPFETAAERFMGRFVDGWRRRQQ